MFKPVSSGVVAALDCVVVGVAVEKRGQDGTVSFVVEFDG